jgi:hypothetical protein
MRGLERSSPAQGAGKMWSATTCKTHARVDEMLPRAWISLVARDTFHYHGVVVAW